MKRKLFILILMMASCALTAQEAGHLLGQKVTITFTEATVNEVLKKLENEVEGMVFMYSPSTLDLKRKVSLSFTQKSLREILEHVFQGLNIEFQEKKNKLLLKPSKPKGKDKGGATKTITEVKKQTQSSPKRRRIIKTSLQANEEASIAANKPVIMASVDKNTVVSPMASANDTLMEKERRTRERAEIPMITNHQKLSIQPMAEMRYNGLVQIKEDSSGVSDKLYKRLLAKEKRLQERANETKEFRIYGSAYTGYTSVNGEAGIQIGGSLIWLKNKRWGFGLSGYAVQSSAAEDPILLDRYRLAGGYGGVSVEYTLHPTDRIHFSFPLMVGGGGIAYNRNNDVGLDPDDTIIEASKAFFVIESGAMVEANVIKYLRVGLGMSYRLTSNTLLNYQSDPAEIASKSSLNGLNFGLTIKFGLF